MKDYFLYTIGYLFRVFLVFLSICFGYMLPAMFFVITRFDYTQYRAVHDHPGYPYAGGLFGIIVFILWVKSLRFRNIYPD